MQIQNSTIQAVLMFMMDPNNKSSTGKGYSAEEISSGSKLGRATIYRVIKYWMLHPEVLPGFRECNERRVGNTRYIKQYYFTSDLAISDVNAITRLQSLNPLGFQRDRTIDSIDLPKLVEHPDDNKLPEELKTKVQHKALAARVTDIAGLPKDVLEAYDNSKPYVQSIADIWHKLDKHLPIFREQLTDDEQARRSFMVLGMVILQGAIDMGEQKV